MTTEKALKLMQADLGRPAVTHIKSVHFPHDVLVVMAEGKIPVPEVEEDSYMREVRLSTFVGESRNSSIIVHSEFVKVEQHD